MKEEQSNEVFFKKATDALEELFERAQKVNEIHFALALMSEFRGMQDVGWSTADDALHAYKEYIELIKKIPDGTPIKIRVMLAFYNHVSEGSGFYEIPKKLLLTIGGEGNNLVPFQKLVKKHKTTGLMIAPNANKVMADMIGHAAELGLNNLAEIIRDAFNPDVRNAVAHADYIIAPDGLRLRRRNGGQPQIIPWTELILILERGINFFNIIRNMTESYMQSYDPPKEVKGRLYKNEPEFKYVIKYNPQNGSFGISTKHSI
ncbi:hypothetical protein [Pelosinus baikalensis]|uniref:Uncharacterized protein n=1 Tax=Pelosinus baikalensis TaxID=2892015 RepID=A0ABS8HWU7_9FIRM|nr:hypothetical protein [Pelosinus baikalensis]MCC5467641.1 hypothetical protein [Pelosinus baikalensis]